MTRDHVIEGWRRDIAFHVVAGTGRQCEAALECADFMERLGFIECAEAVTMLRYHATCLSELAFKNAVRTHGVSA